MKYQSICAICGEVKPVFNGLTGPALTGMIHFRRVNVRADFLANPALPTDQIRARQHSLMTCGTPIHSIAQVLRRIT